MEPRVAQAPMDEEDALFSALFVNLSHKPWSVPEMEAEDAWQDKCAAWTQMLMAVRATGSAAISQTVVNVLQQMTRYEAVSLDTQCFNALVSVSMAAGRQEWAQQLFEMAAQRNQILALVRLSSASEVPADLVLLAMVSENLYATPVMTVADATKNPPEKIMQKVLSVCQTFFSHHPTTQGVSPEVAQKPEKKGPG